MRKIFTVILVFLGISLFAQTEADTVKPWNLKGITTLNMNQASFTNWTAGGTNSLALSGVGKYYADYKKAKFSWNNNLNLMFGFIMEQDEDPKKNEDLIDLTSVLNYQAAKKWTYSLYFNFRTQFYRGNDADYDSVKVSNFMAPGYLTISPGMSYKPNDWFSLLLSPATVRGTFVLDQELADIGSYGVDPAEYDTTGGSSVKVSDGKKSLFQFGAYMEARLLKEIAKGLAFESKLNAFYTYNDREGLEALDMDINWENYLNYKLKDWLSMSFFLHILYYPGQPAFDFQVVDGAVTVGAVPNRRIQLKQTFGIGLTYSFDNKE